MKSIKIVAIIVLLGATLLSANTDKFEKRKEISLYHITKKIELLEHFKSCIANSSNAKAVKSCRQTFKASRASLRAETKAKRATLKGK